MKIFEQISGRTIDQEQSSVAIAQRRWMSLLAFSFPLIFLISSFILGRTEFQHSISDYYWTEDPERNIFVGILCFVASYLILYKGYTWAEDRALDIAGVSAVGIALFPVPQEPAISVHYIFAVTFFICIFYVCIFMSKTTLHLLPPTENKKLFIICYGACSAVMFGIVIFTIVYSLFISKEAKETHNPHIIFWIEAFGIWAFSAYWYIKSRELDATLSFIPLMKKKSI